MKKYKSSVFITVLLLLSSHPSYSDNEKIDILPQLIDEALENNPAIQESFNLWKAATHRITEAAAMPDPTAKYTYFGENIETKVGPQEHKYGVSQRIPFPGKLHLKGRSQSKRAESLREKYEATKREIAKSIKFVYYDIFWVDKAIEITEGEKSILESLEKTARRRFEALKSPQQDVIKAEVEIAKLIDKLFMLKQRRMSLRAKMRVLLNRPKGTPFSKIKDVELKEFVHGLEALHELAGESRQELLAANLDIERAEYERSLATLDFLPDFSFAFDYTQIGDDTTTLDNDGDDAWSTTFAVHVPIWINKSVARMREKQASLRASRKNYENIRNNVNYEVEEIFYRITTYRDIASLYKTALIPQTEQAFEAARTAYEAGRVDFLNWLDSERVVLQTKLAYYKAIVDYLKSIAYMERVVGRDL